MIEIDPTSTFIKEKKHNGIVIMGAGEDAERLYYYLQEKRNNVSFFIDSYKEGFFHGIPIKKVDEVSAELRKYCVLISSRKYYDEMREKLTHIGLLEFDDFIKGGCFERKAVYINGNCYAEVYGELLQSVEEFRNRFFVYYDTPLCDRKDYADEILAKCDVCLSQDVRIDNKYGEKNSLDWHRSHVNKSSKFIVVPNLVGLGKAFYQQSADNSEKNNCNYSTLPYGMFPFSDYIVDDMVQKGKNSNEIISFIKGNSVFRQRSVLKNFNEIINQFIEREKKWDVKIMDYIMECYKNDKVMYDLRHPCGNIYKEIVNRILKELNIVEEVKLNIEVDKFEIPIYPFVAKCLNLQWEKDIRSTPLAMSRGRVEIDDYVREYIYWCYERNLV